MLQRFGFLARPGWLVLHVITLALAVTMVLLGRWQLDVSNAKHFDIQNFGYSIQWWLFTAFGLVFWFRIMRDAVHRREHPDEVQAEAAPGPDEAVPYRRYVMPSSRPALDADPMRSAYNSYLAGLGSGETSIQPARQNQTPYSTQPGEPTQPERGQA